VHLQSRNRSGNIALKCGKENEEKIESKERDMVAFCLPLCILNSFKMLKKSIGYSQYYSSSQALSRHYYYRGKSLFSRELFFVH
jgi:hypothetical protein